MAALKWHCIERQDIVFAQGLSALVTAFQLSAAQFSGMYGGPCRAGFDEQYVTTHIARDVLLRLRLALCNVGLNCVCWLQVLEAAALGGLLVPVREPGEHPRPRGGHVTRLRWFHAHAGVHIPAVGGAHALPLCHLLPVPCIHCARYARRRLLPSPPGPDGIALHVVNQSGLDVGDTAWAPPDKTFPPSKLDVDPVLSRARESLHVVVDVYMGPLFPFHELPKELRQGARIAVVPVLVTQGINEMQTLANAAGHTNVQVDINASAARCLSRYVDICAMSRVRTCVLYDDLPSVSLTCACSQCLPTAAEAAQRVSGVLSLAEVQSRVEMFRTIAGTSRRKKTAKRPDKDVELLWVSCRVVVVSYADW